MKERINKTESQMERIQKTLKAKVYYFAKFVQCLRGLFLVTT
jgi:hypothetical protein